MLWRDGVMFDTEDWLRKITWHTNDLTFEEAFQKTGIPIRAFKHSTSLI